MRSPSKVALSAEAFYCSTEENRRSLSAAYLNYTKDGVLLSRKNSLSGLQPCAISGSRLNLFEVISGNGGSLKIDLWPSLFVVAIKFATLCSLSRNDAPF